LRGKLKFQNGEYRDAIPFFDRAIAHDQNNYEAYDLKCQALQNLGENSAADLCREKLNEKIAERDRISRGILSQCSSQNSGVPPHEGRIDDSAMPPESQSGCGIQAPSASCPDQGVTQLSPIEKFESYFPSKLGYKAKIVYTHTTPPRDAQYGTIKTPLPQPLQTYLDQNGIRLYTHQCEALELVRQKENIILTTSTASGKTLSFNIPIFEDLLANPKGRALYIYPTKALTNDQLKTINALEKTTGIVVNAKRYDGDTPSEERSEIRRTSGIILTNPHELHLVLSYHEDWVSFFSNLRFVVLDEAHYYRGVFGSSIAMVIRRLKRICEHYGSTPQFILSTATIANPLEFGEKLIGASLNIIENDGSPAREKTIYLIQYGEGDPIPLSLMLFTECVKQKVQGICFTLGRQRTELFIFHAQKKLQDEMPSLVNRISSYRGGYLPEDRKKIEKRLKNGDLLGVVSTNALEVGIDIGSLDMAILESYPGTMMSTWQQIGRAGRRSGKSVAILILDDSTLGEYYSNHPEVFFNKSVEHAIIDLENSYILKNHLLCACKELSLMIDNDRIYFGNKIEELSKSLVSDGDFVQNGDLFYYASKDPNIHHHVSLNSIDESSYQLFHGKRLIETMDQWYAYRDTHFHAIYFHSAEKYQVIEFDDANKIIKIQRTNEAYRTKSIQDNQISIAREIYSDSSHSIDLHYGFVSVTKQITGYKVIQEDQVVQTFNLDLPPIRFLTKGTWFDLPDDIIKKVEEQLNLSKTEAKENLSRSIAGICNVISDVASSFLLCDARDIGVDIDEQQDVQTIVIYDDHKGGIGLSEKFVPLFPQIIKMAYDIVNECSCNKGCPKCILSHGRKIKESMRTKKSSIIILKLLLEKIT